MRVHNDISVAMDNGCSAALVLHVLDLSAVFGVIDHSILFKRLEHTYGISDCALAWVKSYFSDRHQRIAVGKVTSEPASLGFGVPQGSVLGPNKYCLYSKPIGDICRKHNLIYHCYAADTHVYLVIRPTVKWENYSSRLEACLSEIKQWVG